MEPAKSGIAPNAIEAEKMWSAPPRNLPVTRSPPPKQTRRRHRRPSQRHPRNGARRVRAIATKYALEIPLFGHIGDGNLHPNILCDRRNAEEMTRVTAAAREIFEAAVDLGGTLSGEHGIGLLKKQFMELDSGPDAHSPNAPHKRRHRPERHNEPRQSLPRPRRRRRLPSLAMANGEVPENSVAVRSCFNKNGAPKASFATKKLLAERAIPSHQCPPAKAYSCEKHGWHLGLRVSYHERAHFSNGTARMILSIVGNDCRLLEIGGNLRPTRDSG